MRRRARVLAVLTGDLLPDGDDADAVRRVIYERFDLSLGTGLGKLKGSVPHRPPRRLQRPDAGRRSAGVEMGLRIAGVPIRTEA